MNTAQKIAKRCLDTLGTYDLDMQWYHCGTSFCMLGFLAHEDGLPEVKGYANPLRYPYEEYARDYLGLPPLSDEFFWLFSCAWSNDVEQAKERCQYIIDHGSAPDYNSMEKRLETEKLLDYTAQIRYNNCIN